MKVALAISSLNGDEQALALARLATSDQLRGTFSAVSVVDSGDPQRCRRLANALWKDLPWVDYLPFEGNLGSAGNLIARLRWAQQNGADAVLTLNADGILVPRNYAAMVDCLERSRAGAVYPTHLMPDERVDLTVLRPVPVLPSRRQFSRIAGQSALRVGWGSSNGALYRVDAVAALDLDRIAEMWYGWEDLAIGLGLAETGHSQLMCIAAAQPTTADQKRLPGTPVVMSDKAPWTTYYGVRNLALLASWYPGHNSRFRARLARELVAILARDARSDRYRFALRGLRDARLGLAGLRVDPATPNARSAS